MAQTNPLVLQFLERHPSDCARILEQLEVDTACSLIRTVEPELAAAVLECMMTSYGADCLKTLDVHAAVQIIKEMKMPQAARLLRAVNGQLSDKILHAMSPHVKNSIRASLRYPDQTAGRLMDSNPFCLPGKIPVSEAIKRIKHIRQRTVHEIFVVDDDHRLTGAVRIADILSAVRTSPLEAILIRDVPFLYARSRIGTAAQNPGWQTFDSLPVVEKDHTLSGVLKSSTLMHVLAETRGAGGSPDALHEMFSLMKMYWIVMAEMLDGLIGRESRYEAPHDERY